MVSDLNYHHEHHRELIDTLRLSVSEQQMILKRLDAASKGAEHEQRRSPRQSYRVAIGLVATLQHPGGSITTYLVRPRDLSATGLCFLHGSYIYPQTQCRFTLRRADGLSHPVDGAVVRCRHVRGRIHEVGVQFDDPVDINLFVVNCVRADPEIEYAGSAEMPKLSGRLLIVDPTDEHHQVLRFHLQKLGVRIRSAAHALAALQAARQEKFDLIITRFHLPWMNAPQAAAALRRGGYTGPIIALTDDPRLAKAPGDNAAGDLSEVRLQPDHFEDLVSWIRDQLRQTQPPQAAA